MCVFSCFILVSLGLHVAVVWITAVGLCMKRCSWHCERLEAFFLSKEWTHSFILSMLELQKLRHRTSLSLMLIYIALNIAVILTDTHTTTASEVGFNRRCRSLVSVSLKSEQIKKNTHQLVWRMEKPSTPTKLQHPHSPRQKHADLWLPWQLKPTHSFSFGKYQCDWWTVRRRRTDAELPSIS